VCAHIHIHNLCQTGTQSTMNDSFACCSVLQCVLQYVLQCVLQCVAVTSEGDDSSVCTNSSV